MKYNRNPIHYFNVQGHRDQHFLSGDNPLYNGSTQFIHHNTNGNGNCGYHSVLHGLNLNSCILDNSLIKDLINISEGQWDEKYKFNYELIINNRIIRDSEIKYNYFIIIRLKILLGLYIIKNFTGSGDLEELYRVIGGFNYEEYKRILNLDIISENSRIKMDQLDFVKDTLQRLYLDSAIDDPKWGKGIQEDIGISGSFWMEDKELVHISEMFKVNIVSWSSNTNVIVPGIDLMPSTDFFRYFNYNKQYLYPKYKSSNNIIEFRPIHSFVPNGVLILVHNNGGHYTYLEHKTKYFGSREKLIIPPLRSSPEINDNSSELVGSGGTGEINYHIYTIELDKITAGIDFINGGKDTHLLENPDYKVVLNGVVENIDTKELYYYNHEYGSYLTKFFKHKGIQDERFMFKLKGNLYGNIYGFLRMEQGNNLYKDYTGDCKDILIIEKTSSDQVQGQAEQQAQIQAELQQQQEQLQLQQNPNIPERLEERVEPNKFIFFDLDQTLFTNCYGEGLEELKGLYNDIELLHNYDNDLYQNIYTRQSIITLLLDCFNNDNIYVCFISSGRSYKGLEELIEKLTTEGCQFNKFLGYHLELKYIARTKEPTIDGSNPTIDRREKSIKKKYIYDILNKHLSRHTNEKPDKILFVDDDAEHIIDESNVFENTKNYVIEMITGFRKDGFENIQKTLLTDNEITIIRKHLGI